LNVIILNIGILFLHGLVAAGIWARRPESGLHRWYAITALCAALWTSLQLDPTLHAGNATIVSSSLFMISCSFRRFTAELAVLSGESGQGADDTLLLALLWLLLALAVPGESDEGAVLLGIGTSVLAVQSALAIFSSISSGSRERIFTPRFLMVSAGLTTLGLLTAVFQPWSPFGLDFTGPGILLLGAASATIAVMMSTQDSFRRGDSHAVQDVYERLNRACLKVSDAGEILYANASARELEGAQRSPGTCRNTLEDWLRPLPEIKSAHLRALGGETVEGQALLKTARGHWVPVEYCFSPSVEDGSFETLCVFQELSDLQATVRRLRESSEGLEKMAYVDALTGGKNRRFLDLELGRRLVEALREETPLSVVMFDLDHFKQVNDLYGHLCGDQLLRDVVSECGRGLREDDTLCRYGGDEFVLILPRTGSRGCRKVAQRLLERISEGCGVGSISVSGSFGLVTYSPPFAILPPQTLLDVADRALLKAKRDGRNLICVGDLMGPAENRLEREKGFLVS